MTITITVPQDIQNFFDAIKHRGAYADAAHDQYLNWLQSQSSDYRVLYEHDGDDEYLSFFFKLSELTPEKEQDLLNLARILMRAQDRETFSIRPKGPADTAQQIILHSDGTAHLRWNQGGAYFGDPRGSLSELRGTPAQIFAVLRIFN